MQTVLVLNSGSSSIKYQLINPDTEEVLASGLCEKIGEDQSFLTHKTNGEKHEYTQAYPDHSAALQAVLAAFDEVGPNLRESNVVACGHRIVQGGKYFSGPALVNQEVLGLIDQLSSLAPLHNPAALKGIQVAQSLLSDIPHVAVFDTAFFQSLPHEAATYALDREVAEKYEIRRYGAHGTSHQYVSQAVSKFLGRDDLKQIVLHLGNGASVSAIVNGEAIDTSMGLTPLEGLVMGTRSGDIDPAVVIHLERAGGMSPDEVDTLLNRKSGMLGLTGDNDMRAVRDMADGEPGEKQQHAREALDIYLHRLLRYIGAYTTEMGGVDAIAFTAGIGENDSPLRRELGERLAPFGIKLDLEANEQRSSEIREISTPDSTVKILVCPTNEELSIARQALQFA